MYSSILASVWAALQGSVVDTIVQFITSLFGGLLPGA